MTKRIFRIASLLLVSLLLFSAFAIHSFALEWDGDSVGGGGHGTNAGLIGYAIRTTNDNVIGYRFSLVDAAGSNKVSKVIDVFRNNWHGDNAYSSLHKFAAKYNKCQLIKKQNGAFSTVLNQTNCYKEANMGFATALPAPDGMSTWQNNTTNLNKVISALGAGSIDNLVLGDKLIVEPIYDVRLESVWHAVTLTEIAVYGKYLFGASSTGNYSGDPETFGFIANYTNKHYPNALFTPDGLGLWPSASATSDRLSFQTIINHGYGVGIAYTQEAGAPEPDLFVDVCEAWPGTFGQYAKCYGYSVGPTLDDWSLQNDYPVMDKNVWFDISFSQEAEDFYVRQTITIDGGKPVSRNISCMDGPWFKAAPDPITTAAGKEYYTVIAREDWIDEDGTVLKYGAEKTFYIPVRPRLNRYQVTAYGCTGKEQASSGMDGTTGAIYYGQRFYARYHYTSDSTWTSYNNLYATMYHWNGSAWESTYGSPDGKSLNAAMTAGTETTVTSSLGHEIAPNNSGSGKNVIPFDMTTNWAADPKHTEESNRYEIPVLISDVELVEVYLVSTGNVRLDPAKLTVGQTVNIRHKYRNNTDCTLYVDGYNNDQERISATGVYRIPANSTIVVSAGSMVVTEENFTLWGGVYLEGAGIYNTTYESDGTNNEGMLKCSTAPTLSLTQIAPNADYREDTSVITSFWLINSSTADVTPDRNISIRMRVYKPDGTLITSQTIQQAIVPASDKNLYSFKWAVPSGLNGSSVRVVADILDGTTSYSQTTRYYTTCIFPYYDTPDTDYEAKAPDGFTVPSAPTATQNYATWSQWVWENNDFVKRNYGIGIALRSNETIRPDTNSNSTLSNGTWTMKSGYGVWLEGANYMMCPSGYLSPPSDSYVRPQYAYAAYPEFGYSTGENVSTTLIYKNGYWYLSDPASREYHYTPIYFPDGNYVVKIVKSDMWTPAGMISAVSTTKPIIIKDSAYDDWFVGRQ